MGGTSERTVDGVEPSIDQKKKRRKHGNHLCERATEKEEAFLPPTPSDQKRRCVLNESTRLKGRELPTKKRTGVRTKGRATGSNARQEMRWQW